MFSSHSIRTKSTSLVQQSKRLLGLTRQQRQMRQPAYQPARQQAAHYRYATARPAYQPPPARLKRSQAAVPLETVDGAAEHT
ncbi:hypothetical protein IG631_17664 [Alternaria alternata]|nr:hypothetical protein IG631_17664 [Alternaria alternata]